MTRTRLPVAPAAIGLWAAAVALAPGWPLQAALLLPPIAGAAVWLLARRLELCLTFLIAALLLTPPLPFAAGNSGAHVAPFVAVCGLLAGLLRLGEWKPVSGPLPALLLAFTAILAASGGLALFYSGPQVAAGSLARVALFALSVWMFLHARSAPFSVGWNPLILVRTLLAIGLAACLFACVDFYLQLPAPAGFGSQFVWLDSGVFRRAQGLFYEASTLGNFCAFLLAVLPAALLTRPADRPAPVWLLSAICLPAVAALVFSYSRASLVNVAVIGLAFLALRRGRVRLRTLLAPALAMASAAAIGSWLFPAFFAHYWTRLGVVFEFFTTSPDRVLSGRLASWRAVADFLWSHPWLAAFGIGYKTLPYTNYLPGGVVADNTYLSLLAETGLLGLSVFLLLNAAILRTAWHAARQSNGRAVFFGSWIFCFWCGELVQMLSGDLITYWRVLPVYLCVLGLAAREAEA